MILLKNKCNLVGEKIDFQDAKAIQKLHDEIYWRSFLSYYQACPNLAPSQGSGACIFGFQSGFIPSKAKTSLFSISATELDFSLKKIGGGDAGMIEVLQKHDSVCRAHNIPFSRLYGGNIILRTGSLVVQIRDYTCPLFAATGGRCEGRLVLAQQATCFQRQIAKISTIPRSATGTTPHIKTYCDLPLHFQTGEVLFGVGFEPSFADLSCAFTVALRRANVSIRNPNLFLSLEVPAFTLALDDGFLLSSEYFTIRWQAPKAIRRQASKAKMKTMRGEAGNEFHDEFLCRSCAALVPM